MVIGWRPDVSPFAGGSAMTRKLTALNGMREQLPGLPARGDMQNLHCPTHMAALDIH